MSSVQDNPCLVCNFNQRCCSQLSGLRLSREEFEKYFKLHAEKLSILKYKKVFLVSTLNSSPCPHWGESGCRIYRDRPVDCRLYPYEITRMVEKRRRIEITFQGNNGCPQRDNLLMPVEEAKALIEDFCQTVYGRGKPTIIKYSRGEKGFSHFFSFLDPVMSRISKILRSYR